jgi:hypothetical protein
MTRGHALCGCLTKYKMAAASKSTECRDSMQINIGVEDNVKKQINSGI